MSILDFIETDNTQTYNTASEQTRLRIKLSIYAYAYEYNDVSLIPDDEFDRMALNVDLSIDTGNKKMDDFFKKAFNPSTGMWIRNHPEHSKLQKIYNTYYA